MRTRLKGMIGAAVIAATAVSTVVPPGPTSAAPGDPATGFGTNGIVTVERGTGLAHDKPVGVVRLPDGRILMVSSNSASLTSGTIDLVRLRADGRRDTTFGPGGRRSIRVEPAAVVNAVALQGDKILLTGVIAGEVGFGTDVFVARITTNGVLDTSFSGDGLMSVDLEEQEDGRVVSPGPGGSVLVAGRADEQAFVMRLTSAGALDSAFGTDGVRRVATGYTDGTLIDLDMHATAAGVVTLVTSDGNVTRIVRLTVSGGLDASFAGDGDHSIDLLPGPETNQRVTRSLDRTYLVMEKSGRLWVVALDASGEADDGFSGDGVELLALDADDVEPTDAIVDASGNLVVSAASTAADGVHWLVARVRPIGGLDPAFAGDGEFDRRFDGLAGASSVIARPAGYLVLGLRRTDLATLALANDGAVLTDFGTNGVRSVDTSREAHGFEPAGVDRAPGGRLLVTGMLRTGRRGQTENFVVLRYRATGELDTTFGRDGIVTADIAGSRDQFVGARQLANGKVLAWGWSSTGDSTSVAVMRFTATGAPDTSFGTNGRRMFTADDTYSRQLDVRLLVDAQDRIVLAHLYDAGGMTGLMVRRLRVGGSDDPSFGTAGRTLLPIAFGESAADLRIRKGRLLVLHLSGLRVVRLTAAGDLDETFGPGGQRDLDLPDMFRSGQGVLRRNGKVVALRSSAAQADVMRLRSDGTVDPSFSDDGLVVVPAFGEPLSQTDQLAMTDDGMIVLGGTALSNTSSAGYDEARSTLTRITPSGELDTTFGGDGRVSRQVVPDDFEFATNVTVAGNGDPILLVASLADGLSARLWRAQG